MYELLSRTPQGAGTPDPQKSIFPQGCLSWDELIRTTVFLSEPSRTRVDVLETPNPTLYPAEVCWTQNVGNNFDKDFSQWNVSLEIKQTGNKEGQPAVRGQGKCGEGWDSSTAMLCPALTRPGSPESHAGKFPGFIYHCCFTSSPSLPPGPAASSFFFIASLFITLPQQDFLYSLSLQLASRICLRAVQVLQRNI